MILSKVFFYAWVAAVWLVVSCGSSVTEVQVEEGAKTRVEERKLGEPKQLHAMNPEAPARSGAAEGCSLNALLPMPPDAGPEDLHALGQESIMAKNGPRAVAILNEANKQDPDNPLILCDFATALLQCRMFDEAVSRAEKAAALAPDNVDITANLAQVYQIAGRLDDAVKTYRRAIKVAPEDAAVHNNLAVLLVLSDLDEAERVVRQAIALEPAKASYLVNLGYILFRKKRLVDAEMVLNRAIGIDSNNADAFNQLGLVLAAQRRNSPAMESFRKALKLNPSHRAARENLNALDQGFDFTGPWDNK